MGGFDKHDVSPCILVYHISSTDSDRCERCAADIQALEQIDDDTDAVGVKFVKTDDAGFAKEVGITDFPTIVYFEKGDPIIYEGRVQALQFSDRRKGNRRT